MPARPETISVDPTVSQEPQYGYVREALTRSVRVLSRAALAALLPMAKDVAKSQEAASNWASMELPAEAESEPRGQQASKTAEAAD